MEKWDRTADLLKGRRPALEKWDRTADLLKGRRPASEKWDRTADLLKGRRSASEKLELSVQCYQMLPVGQRKTYLQGNFRLGQLALLVVSV